MNELFDYAEFGEIKRETPLEAFYEAMRPRLENYGVTAQFPADKPSLAESIYGIEFDVAIGAPPAAVRYAKWQESPYANGAFEMTLEGDALVHERTGEKLSFRIFITDYVSGMTRGAANFWLTLEFRGAEDEVEALEKALAPVLEKYDFRSRKSGEKLTSKTKIASSRRHQYMANNVNFDELAARAFAPNAGAGDFENLFAAVFSLDAWYFIADEKFSYKLPYCAMFPDYFGDAIALTVFTDSARARRFIAEKGIETGRGAVGENRSPNAPENLILRVSTKGILDFFDKLAPLKVTKIFFNPDKESEGFHHDLQMMRPIYEHLKSKNLLAPPPAVEKAPDNLAKLLEENADVIADFERENAMFSSMIAGSAAAIADESDEEKARVVASTAELFESVRVQQNMSPELFRLYIEICLEKQKFLMPVVAFAYLQRDAAKMKKLEQNDEVFQEFINWLKRKAFSETGKPEAEESSVGVQSGKHNAESPGAPFDELSRKVNQMNPPMEDLNALFGAAFALSEWLFIARGELPNVNPYIAANREVAGGQQMIRAFTDSTRLHRFARENDLTEADGGVRMLAVPTEGIVEYLEQFIAHGVHGVWFNSDSGSDGFFVPLKQLRPIKEHLAKLNAPAANSQQSTIKTVLLVVRDGLGFPSGFVSDATYALHIYCRVPASWADDNGLKSDALEKVYRRLYGENWRQGNDDGSFFVVRDASSTLLAEDVVKNIRWEDKTNTSDIHYRFYLAGDDDAITPVEAKDFQAAIDAEMKGQ